MINVTITTVVIAVVATPLLGWLWWKVPKWQLNSLRPGISPDNPKDCADVEDNFRKTFGQALGGAAVLIGAAFAFFQFQEQQQAAHDLLISNQVSKGFEQFAGANTEMRLGGIYALEGVMNDKMSPGYHQPVLEALCAFVREETGKTLPEKPATDVQTALTVIGRRTEGLGVVDLADVSIPGANLSNQAKLSKAKLSKANLSGATLNGADLTGAILTGANLTSVQLNGAKLSTANLSGATLNGADLTGADLTGAILIGVHLRDALLSGATLTGADLTGAFLGADLTGAFPGAAPSGGPANLSGANLTAVKNLTQGQLDKACGTDTKLPNGLTLKPCNVP
jgi:uncharacterized protein YjbI with pentapeptide repeats